MPDTPFQAYLIISKVGSHQRLNIPQPLTCPECGKSHFSDSMSSKGDLFVQCASCHHIFLVFVTIALAPTGLPNPS